MLHELKTIGTLVSSGFCEGPMRVRISGMDTERFKSEMELHSNLVWIAIGFCLAVMAMSVHGEPWELWQIRADGG